MSQKSALALFGADLNVVNVGLRSFAESLADQGVAASDVDWRPPRVPRLRVTLAGVDIEAANTEATARIQQARPTLVGMGIAREVIPGYQGALAQCSASGKRALILHAGPPVAIAPRTSPPRSATSRASLTTSSLRASRMCAMM